MKRKNVISSILCLTLSLIVLFSSTVFGDLILVVDGQVGLDEFTLGVNETATIDIYATEGQLAIIGAVIGVDSGPASIALGPERFNLVEVPFPPSPYFLDLTPAQCSTLGLSSAVFFDMCIPEIPVLYMLPDGQAGIAAGGAVFQCEGAGDVTLIILDVDRGIVYDQITIHQTNPEPASAILLALGGLLIRRKQKP